MIDYKVGDVGLGSAYLYDAEVNEGKKIVYLGGNIEMCNRIMKNRPEQFLDERIPKHFSSYKGFLVSNIESVLSHESIHLTIWDLTHSMEAVKQFDNIDNRGQITGLILGGEE